MKYKICIIGAGQLGSRHLQSLVFLNFPVTIYVCDPSNESLAVAKKRWEEVDTQLRQEIHFLNAINDLPREIDIAIVATNANVRSTVVEQLTSHTGVKYLILEKFLFQNESDYSVVSQILEKNKIQAWVNCPRRMYPFYQELKEILNHCNNPVRFSVQGFKWGMGCNTIHFLDLFYWLTGGNDILNFGCLFHQGIEESKRPGFVEFTGQLLAENSGGDSFLAISNKSGEGAQIITIDVGNVLYRIVESKSSVFRLDIDGGVEIKKIDIPFQSQLTNIIVSELFESGTCRLTPYSESASLHLLLLKQFLNHHNSVKSTPENKICPIT